MSPIPNRMGALTFRSSFASEIARRLGEVGVHQEQEVAGGREEGLTTGLTPRQSEHGRSHMPPPRAPPNSRRIGRSLSERRNAATGETGGSGRRTGSLQAGDRVPTTGTAASGGRRTQLHQTLERRRRGFTAELADLRGDAEELGEGPIPKAKLDIMEREGDRLRDSIQQIGEDYQNCMDEANERKEVEDLELESADFDEWARKELRELRKEIRSHIQDHPSAAGGFSHIERVKLPSFGGEAQEFHEFRRTFTELTRGANYPPAVMMAQLRARISGEPLKLIEGHTEVAGAWKELERRYGSKDLAVVTSRQKLLNLTLKGPSYEQVETLLQAVRTARTTLKSHKAEKLLFGDDATVGLLVSKLPAAAQDRWDFHTASLAPEDTPQGRGEQFCSWLEREGAAAASARLRNLACEQQRGAKAGSSEAWNTKCNKCGKSGHKSWECHSGAAPTQPTLQGSALAAAGGLVEEKKSEQSRASQDPGHIPKEEWALKLKTREGSQQLQKRLEAQGADCPACRKIHHYRRKLSWGETDWPSSRFDSCPAFMAATPPQRAKMIDDQGGCSTCLSWGHPRIRCSMKEPRHLGPGARTLRCQQETAGGLCGKDHHKLLHGAEASHGTVNAARLLLKPPGEPRPDIFLGRPGDLLAEGAAGAVFEILEAKIISQEGRSAEDRVFIDGGSNMNFITHKLAEKLQLEGKKTDIFLKVVDSEYQSKEVNIFQLGVLDRDGETHWMEAVGVQSITDAVPLVDKEVVRKAFPEILEEALERPVGPVGVLLSMTERNLHGSGGKAVGKMRLCNTPLGCGQVLTGVIPRKKAARGVEELSAECRSLQGAMARLPSKGQAFFIGGLGRAVENVLGVEELEAEAPPLCQACRGCRDCKFKRERCTDEQREVLEQVEREMTLEDGKLTASYPWKACVSKMRNNRQQVLKIQEKIETRNISNGTQEDYIKEMEKAIAEGTVKELSREEIDNYAGPVNYNNHFEVLKEGSVSTALRIVSNSAQKNARSGLSLNDCMKKGPDEMALLAEVLLHFRTVEKAIILDLTKAYNAIRMREKELHLRRILWRKGPLEEWRDYGYTRATFGDLAAALLLEVGKRRAAETGQSIDPMAAQQIKEDLYVDDGFVGGTSEDVERMLGEAKEDGSYSGTVARILGTCGLRAKFMAVTGDSTPGAETPLGGKVLGLSYQLAQDKFTLQISMKFNIKGRARLKQEVELTSNELERLRKGERSFSKREALSFVAGTFDPLGCLGPALLTGRLLLRRLQGDKAVDWDSDLPEEEKRQWIGWHLELAQEASIAMKRTVRPQGAVGDPILAGFADASIEAMCAVVYSVWETPGGPKP